MKLSYRKSVFFIVFGFLFIFTSVTTSPASRLPDVPLSTKPLDLSRTPTTEELMAAGQLGGQLFPTADIEVTASGLSKAQAGVQAAAQEQSQEHPLRPVSL
ncbi:MAG: hypothetical protein D3906_15235, partial [Candidatus Electrothrix sp. AUS1_2]|nr:hypothetical protein [Candidatus Electrothrix sp. AUS1_2]